MSRVLPHAEPKDDTVYQFEEAIENLYGKFKIKLEKNRLTEIDDVAKVSVLMTSAVRYDMTVGSFEEENDNEILMCKAIFTDNDGTVHELNVGTQGASDRTAGNQNRRGEKIRKNFYLPAAQQHIGQEKKSLIPKEDMKSCCICLLLWAKRVTFTQICTYSYSCRKRFVLNSSSSNCRRRKFAPPDRRIYPAHNLCTSGFRRIIKKAC